MFEALMISRDASISKNFFSYYFDIPWGQWDLAQWNGTKLVRPYYFLFLLCMQPPSLFYLCMKTKNTINLHKHMNIYFFDFVEKKIYIVLQSSKKEMIHSFWTNDLLVLLPITQFFNIVFNFMIDYGNSNFPERNYRNHSLTIFLLINLFLDIINIS